ncbi:MAG: rhomboid family intramembrane serine protease [Candidatus Melainabacteria bacterium]|nr:rhomboid family intramembrane serine protease [Candidatus Melainabacteria bacterium]
MGSFHKTLFLSGEFWRAGTAALLHANEAHLFNNLVSLLIMGHLLERDLGFWRMLALMLVAQAGTIAVSLLTPDHFSMGASGITYGLTGAFISRALLQEGLQALRGLQPWRAFFKSLQGALGYVLILTLLNWQMMDVVDVWGHLGGFVAGAALVAWWHVFEAAPHSVKPIQNPKNAD